MREKAPVNEHGLFLKKTQLLYLVVIPRKRRLSGRDGRSGTGDWYVDALVAKWGYYLFRCGLLFATTDTVRWCPGQHVQDENLNNPPFSPSFVRTE